MKCTEGTNKCIFHIGKIANYTHHYIVKNYGDCSKQYWYLNFFFVDDEFTKLWYLPLGMRPVPMRPPLHLELLSEYGR